MKKNRSRVQSTIIEVTQEIIATAKPKDSGHCMIADAIAAAIPDAKHIAVDLATVRFTLAGTGKRYIYLTPSVCQLSLISFDQEEIPDPFRFRLCKPAQIIKSGNQRTAEQKERRKATYQKGNGPRAVGTKVGGRPLPKGNLGHRREFGMRVTTAGKKQTAEQ